MRALFLIRSLERGGAEQQLVLLANGLAEQGHDVSVAVFYGDGELERELEAVRLVNLKKTGRWDVCGFLFRLVRLLRRERPDVLHAYLGTANALSVLLKPLLGKTRVAWGVRASDMDLQRYDRLTRWSFTVERRLSRFADAIIVNSEAGLHHAAEQGFPRERMTVIPNGIDTDRFRPDPAAGASMRARWGVPADALLIGLPARIDPIKDHGTFLRAAALLSEQRPSAFFVCIGGGNLELRHSLEGLAHNLDIGERTIWAGEEGDMPAAYNALDVCCLSSVSEGFPNVLGEAMACGVPCAATDVGDAAAIIGDTGVVVPKGSPERLAEALDDLLRDGGKCDAEVRRVRIVERFSLARMVERSETLLASLAH